MAAEMSACLGSHSSYPPSVLLRPPANPTRAIRRRTPIRCAASSSYLDMWRSAMERERRSQVLHSILARGAEEVGGDDFAGGGSLLRKTEQFNRIVAVPKEERDRVQRMQVIDRAAAAIAAARALVEHPAASGTESGGGRRGRTTAPPVEMIREGEGDGEMESTSIYLDREEKTQTGLEDGEALPLEFKASQPSSPGPDFWSWSPPKDNSNIRYDPGTLQPKKTPHMFFEPSISLMEKEKTQEIFSLPFQSTLSESKLNLPPLQSFVELEKKDELSTTNNGEHDELSRTNAAEAAAALGSNEIACYGVNPDGSKWWKETGVEQRPNGVVCKWTLMRGVSANEDLEWEDKYWEASDQLDYKELGSEKSGRDASGRVWRESWKESMWQDLESGLLHMEKKADKWGKNADGTEWHEKWWEHYDESGQAEKWAHKWCSIDPTTPLDAGHAHIWHERWGEKYDGNGASVKYTDKWAERSEGDGWSKWGDKWDENFDVHGHGVKQGETWWTGKHGENWNRTWGEGHNGSGWIHKYGKSSSGEHWDTHMQEDTWYERYPHFGFDHCFENSQQLRQVPNLPPMISDNEDIAL